MDKTAKVKDRFFKVTDRTSKAMDKLLNWRREHQTERLHNTVFTFDVLIKYVHCD